jgi:hypothetical protein
LEKRKGTAKTEINKEETAGTHKKKIKGKREVWRKGRW